MKDIADISGRYRVRKLEDADADSILTLCRENTQFYRYSRAEPAKAEVLRDLHITPPGIGPDKKLFLGFFEGERLRAVMDLIDGYPAPEYAYIGFFMMEKALQGKGLGSALINETAAWLRASGKRAVRLAIDRENPQSNHFWRKNGFRVIREAEADGHAVYEAERTLLPAYGDGKEKP